MTSPAPDPLVGADVAVVGAGPRAEELAAELQAAGCIVRRFDAPGHALVATIEGRFDALVALAARGAGLDAPTLCRVVRRRAGAGVALLLLCEEGTPEVEFARGLEAGADDCLSAPVPAERLRARLRVALAAATRATRKTSLAPARPAPTPPCLLDGHELRRVLGAGAFGTVYEARPLGGGPRVALKLLCDDVGEDLTQLARFLREAELLAEVRSPHVARVFGAGWADGRFYLVMQLAAGRSATHLMARDGTAPLGAVLRLARDVSAAIEALDRRGLVHRDIKPANILVRRGGAATLVDFGLVKRRDDPGVTRAAELLGSPAYLAPEIVRGQPHDTASDLYALGVTLWELLVGFVPFTGVTVQHLLETIAEGRPSVEVSRLRPHIPSSVSQLVARLMEPDPRRRLADPGAARAAFAAFSGPRGWTAGLPRATSRGCRARNNPSNKPEHGGEPGSRRR